MTALILVVNQSADKTIIVDQSGIKNSILGPNTSVNFTVWADGPEITIREKKD